MAGIDDYRAIVERILREYAQLCYAYGRVERHVVIDRERDHYLLMIVGWDRKRVHDCLIHVDIIRRNRISGKCRSGGMHHPLLELFS